MKEPLLKLLNVFFASLFAMSLAACGNSSSSTPAGGGGGGGDINVDELGYNPATRWPEVGSYSYDFDVSYNGSRCQAKKEFGNKADYCMGLQDQALNSSCALEPRKGAYKSECGPDFQETNFKNYFFLSGFDSRLQKRCQTGLPKEPTFKTTKSFCNFLKDEVLHNSCFWDGRKDKFDELRCTGDFSPEPSVVIPVPTPVPTPQPTPSPTPGDPTDEIPVVQELRAHGIKVSVDWSAIRLSRRFPLPGDTPIPEQMKLFWEDLAANKSAVLQRQDRIAEINVTSYTHYRTNKNDRSLDLDFDGKRGDLAEYFPLFDKLLTVSSQLDIEFSMIQSGSRRDSVSYLPLRQVLSAVEKNWADLVQMTGAIEELELNSYAAYFSQSRTLTLRYEHIEADFTTYIGLLKPLAPIMSWAKKRNVELKTDFDVEKDREKVQAAFQLLETQLPSLNQLVRAGMLEELTLWYIDGEQNFWPSSKSLSLSIHNNTKEVVSKALVSLGKLAKMSLESHKKMDTDASELNENFFKSFALLETVWPQIQPKLPMIKTITVGYESSYYEGSQELTVGAGSTLQETQKVIAEIK
jgi:hypothetical protein